MALPLLVLLLIAVVVGFIAWYGVKLNPVIAGVLALFAVLIILGNFFAIFGWAGLMNFLNQQSWIIAISGGYLVGSVVGVFS